MEETEIKSATPVKGPEPEGVAGEDAKGVATSESIAPTTAIDSTTPLLLSVRFPYSIANLHFLVFSY